MNKVLFRTNETTVIYAGENKEPQVDTGNNFFFNFYWKWSISIH